MNTLFFLFFFVHNTWALTLTLLTSNLTAGTSSRSHVGNPPLTSSCLKMLIQGCLEKNEYIPKTLLDDWLHFSSHKKKDLLSVFGWVSIHVNYKGSDIVGRRGTYQFSGHPGRGHIGLGPWWRGGNNNYREGGGLLSCTNWLSGGEIRWQNISLKILTPWYQEFEPITSPSSPTKLSQDN